MTNIYNKFFHNQNGTLIGNWYEEECLRKETDENRGIKPTHIPKRFMCFENEYDPKNKMDDTFQRTIGNRPYNSFTTEYQTYGDFARHQPARKKYPMKDIIYNNYLESLKGLKEEEKIPQEEVKIEDPELIKQKQLQAKMQQAFESMKQKIIDFDVKHGWMGLRNMKQYFRRCSDSHNDYVFAKDFKLLLLNYGVYLADNEMNYVMTYYQNDKKDVNYEELFNSLIFCDENRFKIIEDFIKQVRECCKVVDETVLVEDLLKLYNYKIHPEFLSGKKNQGEIKQDYEKAFGEAKKVLIPDIIQLLCEISTCIPDEGEFLKVMKSIGMK